MSSSRFDIRADGIENQRRLTDEYYYLNSKHTDPKRLKKEREKARELKKTPWWKDLLKKGECHYCNQIFPPSLLTMDHVVPLARGGESKKANIVPACQSCNADKKLTTPAEKLLKMLQDEKKK